MAQIYASMSKHDIVPIFACTADVLHVYQNLTELLPGSAAVELNRDSSNIVDIISEEYAVCMCVRAWSSHVRMCGFVYHMRLSFRRAFFYRL